MKKNIYLFMAVVVLIVLIGGGTYFIFQAKYKDNKEVLNNQEKKNNYIELKGDEQKEKENIRVESNKDKEINVSSKQTNINPLVLSDFFFKGISPGKKFKNFDGVIEMFLGKAIKVEENVSNDAEIKGKTYYYPSYKLITCIDERNSIEFIEKITITGNEVTTERGITVGDTEEKIIEKYGKGDKFAGDTYSKYGYGPEGKYDGDCYSYQINVRDEKSYLVDNISDFGIIFYVKNKSIEKIVFYNPPQ